MHCWDPLLAEMHLKGLQKMWVRRGKRKKGAWFAYLLHWGLPIEGFLHSRRSLWDLPESIQRRGDRSDAASLDRKCRPSSLPLRDCCRLDRTLWNRLHLHWLLPGRRKLSCNVEGWCWPSRIPSACYHPGWTRLDSRCSGHIQSSRQDAYRMMRNPLCWPSQEQGWYWPSAKKWRSPPRGWPQIIWCRWDPISGHRRNSSWLQ